MKTNVFVFSLLLLLALTGCNKATYLNTDKDTLRLPKESSGDSLILHSDVNDFKIASVSDWIEPKLCDSILVINVGENKTGAPRTGMLLVVNGDQKLSIKVSQASNPTFLTLSAQSVTIPQDGSAVTLSVETDGANVKLEGLEGVMSSYSEGKLSISSKGNTGETKKSKAYVVCDTIRRPLTVIESGTICARCKGSGKVVCYICKGEGVTYCPYMDCVTCGGSTRVTCPDCHGKGK